MNSGGIQPDRWQPRLPVAKSRLRVLLSVESFGFRHSDLSRLLRRYCGPRLKTPASDAAGFLAVSSRELGRRSSLGPPRVERTSGPPFGGFSDRTPRRVCVPPSLGRTESDLKSGSY